MEEITKIVVVGASAGGLKAIFSLLDTLKETQTISIFVVLHVSKKSMGEVLATSMQKHTQLICKIPADMEKVRAGHLYVAPPDFHMLLKDDYIRIIQGATENRWRPSIDVLFRSAAVTYSSKVIGIILTGLLDDGTSGMGAIKSSGGKTVVQEPAEAEFEDMPRNVLNNVEVDYRVPVSDMGYVLEDLIADTKNGGMEVPRDVKIEAEITERMVTSTDALESIGNPSDFTCPDCGGRLWELNDKSILRYRCYTGHVYTQKLLLEKQSEELEETLWVALRMLEERRNLLRLIASREQENKSENQDNDHNKERLEELETHISRLKKLMISISEIDSAGGFR